MAHPRTIRPGELTAAQLEQPQTDAPPAVTQATAMVALAKAIGGGPLLAGFVGGVLAVAGHSLIDSEKIVHRIERLEAAMVSTDEHNAWVQAALLALSEKKPLPPPPYRRMAPP